MRALGCIVVAFLVCAAWAGPAAARDFPADAVRARFTVIQYPIVKLGRHHMRLAPGAQIRDPSNQIIMAPSLDGTGTYHSLYTLDRSGEVFRVWLLTDDEVAALKSQGR
jgi:hypothetical protein